MNTLLKLHRDRKRAQRGSVLSGVLIMVAFLAIISGALVTELSTHFLVSRVLVNRVGNEATVNSAVELSLDKLQNTPLNSPCPALTGVTALNGHDAAVSYVSCWPTVDRGSPQQFVPMASSAAFNFDGMRSVFPGISQDLYTVADSAGMVYQFPFGQTTPNWSRAAGGTVTGPLLTMLEDAASPADIAILVPISGGSCGPGNMCVSLLSLDVGGPPDVFCVMPTNDRVTARPAAGINFPKVAFFGDQEGWLYAYTNFTENPVPQCALSTKIQVPFGDPVVAGPIVLGNGPNDEIYLVTSSGKFLHYTYNGASFSLPVDNFAVSGNAVGMAVEPTAVPPARVAIAFGGGAVAMVRIDTAYHAAVITPATSLGSAMWDAPYWCQLCGNLIGIGVNGTLYVLDTNLAVVGSYAGGSLIQRTPGVDAAGDWFFGADDGKVYEVQLKAGQPAMTLATTFGSAGVTAIRSSPVVGGCPIGICIHLGSANGTAYLIPIDARDAVLTACISPCPPAGSGDNPRLWAQVEVGVAGNPQTVHVQGWSYYSP